MCRPVWIGLFAALTGCAPSEPSEPGGEDLGVPTTRVIAVAEDGSRAEVGVALTPDRLAGRYAFGMLGFSLALDLRADGQFDLQEGGCLGVYGTASGGWHLDPDGVALVTTRADGVLAERPPGRMAVATLGGRYLLVAESDRDLFIKGGPSRVILLDPLAVRTARGAAAEPGAGFDPQRP